MAKSRVLPFSQLMSYTKMVYIEFREFPSSNTWFTIGRAMFWVARVFKHYEIKNPQYGKHYRFWTREPNENERKNAKWEE